MYDSKPFIPQQVTDSPLPEDVPDLPPATALLPDAAPDTVHELSEELAQELTRNLHQGSAWHVARRAHGHVDEAPLPPGTAAGPDDGTLPPLDAALAELLEPPAEPARTGGGGSAPVRHRKKRPQRDAENRDLSWRRVLSRSSVVLSAVIVLLVSMLGAVASYEPLRALADGVAQPGVAQLWPLLIYCPWVVATLSILRARAYKRRTLHSWLVVIFFAGIAALLCVTNAPHTPAGITVAGLPPITVLLCFHQLVRQLDLSPSPATPARHAHAQRRTHRHRSY